MHRFWSGAASRGVTFLCLGTAAAHAQYVDPRDHQPREIRFFSIGLHHRTFGPLGSNSLPASSAIDFSALMPTVEFRQGNVDIQFGYASYKLRGATRAAIHVGTTLGVDLPLGGRGPGPLTIPFFLAADFMKAETDGPQRDNVNLASVGIGLGAQLRTEGESARLLVQAGGLVHFAFEGLSTGTGVSTALVGDAALLLPSFPVADGLVLGYRARWQQWSMSRSALNYRAFTHGPYLGVMF